MAVICVFVFVYRFLKTIYQRYSLFLLLPLFFCCIYVRWKGSVFMLYRFYFYILNIYRYLCWSFRGREPCVFISVEFSSVFIRWFLVFSAVRVLFRVILCPFLCYALLLMMKLFVVLLMLWPLLLFRLSISMLFHRYIRNPNWYLWLLVWHTKIVVLRSIYHRISVLFVIWSYWPNENDKNINRRTK